MTGARVIEMRNPAKEQAAAEGNRLLPKTSRRDALIKPNSAWISESVASKLSTRATRIGAALRGGNLKVSKDTKSDRYR